MKSKGNAMKSKGNAIEIPTEKTFEKLQIRLPVEVIERLRLFHLFVQQEHGQSHATFDRVMEYVFEEYFKSPRGALKGFKGWRPSEPQESLPYEPSENESAAAE